MFDSIIIGTGFAGAIMAEQLACNLGQKVLLIEKRSHIGGNCYDRIDENGILIHQYGPHLFHTSNQEVWEYLCRFSVWQPYEHHVLAHIDGQNIPIPFNLNTIDALFSPELAERLNKKLTETFSSNSKIPILELKKSSDPDLLFLADFIYEKVFLHYTAKQWGLNPEDLDPAVTARVPVFIGRDNRYFNDTFQALPSDGYTKLFENILNHPNISVRLNTDFKTIGHLSDGQIYINNELFKGKLIYTGAIDELFDYCFGELPYRSVDMKFETLQQEFFQEAATINYPNNHAFTRITEFKHIHPCTAENTTILKEYPQPHIADKTTPYYPIFTNENQKNYERYADLAQHYPQLVLLGRLAEYKYYDMDDIVAQAFKTFKHISQKS
jgi:UDP-galactopyranose mutase